jgi:hypothetical protein
MKNTVFKCVTAIICAVILSLTTMTGINNLAKAELTAAEKSAGIVQNAGVSSDDTSVNQDYVSDDSTDIQQDVPSSDEPTNEAPADENTPSEAPEETKPEDTSKTMTTEEIVNLFNTSANKIKTTAKKVVKNYEKRTVNEEQLKMPENLEATGREMMKKFMSDDTEPIVYDTKEDIRNEYIVPDQDYVSKLTPATVVQATCVDKGSTYEIYFKLKDQKNPSAGNGVGAVCDVIEGYEIAEKVSMIQKFDTYYSNCEIKATIDKATGRMVHTNYKTPVLLDLTINFLGTHDVSVGYTFEKDYTISY